MRVAAFSPHKFQVKSSPCLVFCFYSMYSFIGPAIHVQAALLLHLDAPRRCRYVITLSRQRHSESATCAIYHMLWIEI